MEKNTLDLIDYLENNPDQRENVYESLGVDSDEEFDKFVKDTMFKIGRPI